MFINVLYDFVETCWNSLYVNFLFQSREVFWVFCQRGHCLLAGPCRWHCAKEAAEMPRSTWGNRELSDPLNVDLRRCSVDLGILHSYWVKKPCLKHIRISIHILHINSSHLSISSTHHISTDNDNGEGAQNKHIDLDNVDHNNHSPPSSDMISMILYDIIRLNDLIILIESCLTV